MSDSLTPKYDLGLFYLSGHLEESDFSLIKSDLNENGIGLKAIDKSGRVTASIEDFTNVFSFLVNSPLAMGLVSGILASAGWESIKTVILRTFKKIRSEKYSKITRNGVESKQITFGIEIKINNDHYNFNFNGISSDEAIHEALDKIIPLLKDKQLQSNESNIVLASGLPNYIATYDEALKIWIVRGTNEIILGKIQNSKQI
ncbi:hypothetical protein B4V02_07710 [Paenibacillus kribbensis]|uniref:Uncharacterized protein n=1 Tax=Paenibacillus kribbensis TaxID=172713 RepID=A0A222WKR2_9BACL|nr:hypothetical protein [Paenibacillus kribbensis]ASR46568.1 hypothetical protein B4V02_07710 [Paenibacillus kribbensis]